MSGNLACSLRIHVGFGKPGKHGNHLVSVAKQRDRDYIDAEVIEMSTSVDLPTATDRRDMIRLGIIVVRLRQEFR
jgi:hypothetical protein